MAVLALLGILGGFWAWRSGPEAQASASITELLNAPKAPDWRWHRLQANPAILVIEFPGLADQGRAMNRMAALFEKRTGKRDRLLSDAEMDSLLRSSGDNVSSFFQGHDYTGEMLARFYSMAAVQHAPLNAQELRLRELLVGAAVLHAGQADAYTAIGKQAVVSFTAVQADDPATEPDESVDALRRESVLRHELSHGEFFTNDAYRAHAWNFWRRLLAEHERQMLRRYLQSLDYDPADEELMVNETQAVLMHTHDPRAFSAASLGIGEVELAGLRARFGLGEPQSSVSAAPAR